MQWFEKFLEIFFVKKEFVDKWRKKCHPEPIPHLSLFKSIFFLSIFVEIFVGMGANDNLRLEMKHMAPPGGATSKRPDCLFSYWWRRLEMPCVLSRAVREFTKEILTQNGLRSRRKFSSRRGTTRNGVDFSRSYVDGRRTGVCTSAAARTDEYPKCALLKTKNYQILLPKIKDAVRWELLHGELPF